MGVVTIIFFFVMLSVVSIAMGGLSFGLIEILVLLAAGVLGIGGLIGTLRIIEPDRGETH